MKKFIFVSLLFVLTACSSAVQQKNLDVEVAKKLFEAFNRYDWKAMADLYSDTALFLDPSFGDEFVQKTRSETISKYTEMQTLVPDIHDKVIALYSSHEAVIIEFVSTGTSPDGTKFRLPIVSILTIRDGLIVKDATYYDL